MLQHFQYCVLKDRAVNSLPEHYTNVACHLNLVITHMLNGFSKFFTLMVNFFPLCSLELLVINKFSVCYTIIYVRIIMKKIWACAVRTVQDKSS